MIKNGSSLLLVVTLIAAFTLVGLNVLQSACYLSDLALQRIDRMQKEAALDGALSYAIVLACNGTYTKTIAWPIKQDQKNMLDISIEKDEYDVYTISASLTDDDVRIGHALCRFLHNVDELIIFDWNISIK